MIERDRERLRDRLGVARIHEPDLERVSVRGSQGPVLAADLNFERLRQRICRCHERKLRRRTRLGDSLGTACANVVSVHHELVDREGRGRRLPVQLVDQRVRDRHWLDDCGQARVAQVDDELDNRWRACLWRRGSCDDA